MRIANACMAKIKHIPRKYALNVLVGSYELVMPMSWSSPAQTRMKPLLLFILIGCHFSLFSIISKSIKANLLINEASYYKINVLKQDCI